MAENETKEQIVDREAKSVLAHILGIIITFLPF